MSTMHVCKQAETKFDLLSENLCTVFMFDAYTCSFFAISTHAHACIVRKRWAVKVTAHACIYTCRCGLKVVYRHLEQQSNQFVHKKNLHAYTGAYITHEVEEETYKHGVFAQRVYAVDL